MAHVLAAIVLAAGAGRRFGGVKQLAPFRGRPLLEHALAAARGAGAGEVIVVLGAHAEEILAGADLSGTRPILCGGWANGQAASLRAGLEAVPGADGVLVLLGDQPLITAAAAARIAAARGGGVLALRATYGGVPAHPVLLEAPLFARVADLRGDRGARDVLDEVETRLVPCDGLGDPGDADTREALARLEAVPTPRAARRAPRGNGA